MNEDYPGFIAITECDSLLWWKPLTSRYDCKLGNALPLTTSDKSFWWIIQIYKFWKLCVMFCMCKHISKWENSWWIKCFVLVLWIISSCSSTSWLSQSFFHEFPFMLQQRGCGPECCFIAFSTTALLSTSDFLYHNVNFSNLRDTEFFTAARLNNENKYSLNKRADVYSSQHFSRFT